MSWFCDPWYLSCWKIETNWKSYIGLPELKTPGTIGSEGIQQFGINEFCYGMPVLMPIGIVEDLPRFVGCDATRHTKKNISHKPLQHMFRFWVVNHYMISLPNMLLVRWWVTPYLLVSILMWWVDCNSSRQFLIILVNVPCLLDVTLQDWARTSFLAIQRPCRLLKSLHSSSPPSRIIPFALTVFTILGLKPKRARSSSVGRSWWLVFVDGRGRAEQTIMENYGNQWKT